MKFENWPHVYRPGAKTDAAALLLLHGTGGTEHDLIALADRVAPGARLLSPRGQVSEQGAARFFPRLSEGRFNPAEVIPRIDELAAFLAAAARRYGIGSFAVLGFSNGANAAAALLQLHPELPIRDALLLRPMVVLDQAARAGTLARRRVLLLNGAQDPIVPPDHPERLARLLRAGDAEVETQVHAGAGHGLVAEDLARTSAFLRSRPAA